MESYLHKRTQIVERNQSFSCPMLVTRGVAQGSIVRPSFFILFVQDLPEYPTECSVFGYCDDMKIVLSKTDPLRSDTESLE